MSFHIWRQNFQTNPLTTTWIIKVNLSWRMNCKRKAHKEKKNFNYVERKYLPTRGKGK
jgi:hypothetical protein